MINDGSALLRDDAKDLNSLIAGASDVTPR
jgi:hypothetical protein